MAWFVKRGQIQRCQLRREKSPAVLYLSAVQMLSGRKDSRTWGLHSAPTFRPPHLPCLSFFIYLPLSHILSPRLTAGISLLSLFCSSLFSFSSWLSPLPSSCPLDDPAFTVSYQYFLLASPTTFLNLLSQVSLPPISGCHDLLSFWTCCLKIA